MKGVLYLFLFFSSSTLIFFYYKKHNTDANSVLQNMNKQEKEILTNFFKYSFFCDGLGYVIFYDKPMCFMTVNFSELEVPENINPMDPVHIFNRYNMPECWEAWSRFSRILDLKNFSVVSYRDSEFLHIFFVNHINFTNVVSKNLKDFHTVLGIPFTAQEILNEFIKGNEEIHQKIIKHDGLFGTLLGFGRNNAWEYMKQDGGQNMEFFRILPPKGSHEIPGLNFAIIPSEETNQVRMKYEYQRQQINSIYHSDNFLEQVLNKLIS